MSTVDIIGRLSQNDRLSYLVYGYIRKIQKKIKKTIPNDIKELCKQYTKFKIKSKKDILIQETMNKGPVKFYFIHILNKNQTGN